MKILFLTSNLGFFKTHFFESWIEGNWNKDGLVVTGKTGSIVIEKNIDKYFELKNIKYRKFDISGGFKINIIELVNIYKIFHLLQKKNFDLIRTSSPKFGLIGLILAYFLNIKIVYMVSGVGYLGSTNNIFFRIVYKIVKYLTIYLIKNTKSFIIVENTQDYFYWKNKINKYRVKILCGSGVSKKFYKDNEEVKQKIILFPSRFLVSKGAKIFIECANILKKKYPDWEFVMIGADDYNNPHLLNKVFLNKAKKNNIVKILPFSDNLNDILKKTSIVCLPTWREGKSKVLLEASAARCGIVTTDVVGCNDVYKNNVNSILVKKNDITSLTLGIEKLINDKELLNKIQNNAKYNPALKSSLIRIVSSTKKIYNEINEKF